MELLLTALPQLAGLIEKGGVVGVLLIVAGVLVWEIKRGRKQLHDMRDDLHVVYGQRDLALLTVVKLKTICEAHKIKVDLSDLKDLLPKPEAS
jgi:hypothetical protein